MALIRTVLDFETAYGIHPETKESINLSKMTSEEYVRHPLFKVHGLGVKIDNERTFYVYGQDLIRFLRSHPWERSFVIAHHAHFDGAILSWRAKIKPAFWGCTLSMGRALFHHQQLTLDNLSRLLGVGEKGKELASFKNKWDLTPQEQKIMGGYCCNDVDLTACIFDKMVPYFPVSELRLIDLIVRMFTEPVLQVERGVLIDEYKRERRAKRELLKKCGVTKEELASNPQFAQILLDLNVDPPKKLSPSKVKDGRVTPETAGEPPRGILPTFKATGSKEERLQLAAQRKAYPWAYAFSKGDEEFKLLLDHPNPQVKAVVEARLGVKSTLKETRSKRFFKIGTRGSFPVYHNYYGARTGRDSGGDKQNTTNLNRVNPKDPTSGALRKSLIAPDGHMLVVRDLGQIEARKAAYVAGQEDLLELFRQGGDPYNRQASLIFGYEVDRKQPEFDLEGKAGKAAVLGCGYGMGWSKFQESLRIGFMGMPPLLFTTVEADKLGADIDEFCYQKSYKKEYAFLRDEALVMKPLDVSEEDHLWHCAAVKKIVDGYRGTNAAIKSLWREAGQALFAIEQGEQIPVGKRNLVTTCKEGFLLPNGMKIRYNKLKSDESGNFRYLSNVQRKEWSYIYGGKAVENIVQALSRIVLTDQMLNVQRWLAVEKAKDPGMFYQVVTSTYDEIVVCVPEYRAEETLEMMKIEMATAPPWCPDLPLKSSGGYAKNYGDCEH